MRTIDRLWLPGGEDPDRLLLPWPEELRPGEPIMRMRSPQDRGFRRELRRAMWRDEAGVAPSYTGPTRLMKALAMEFLFLTGGAAGWVQSSPNTITTTLGRAFPFFCDGSLYVAKIRLDTPAALAASFQLGIFDAGGAQQYVSGAQGTAALQTVLTPTNPVLLPSGGTYYLVMTNNNLASATNAFYFSAALAATHPRWGTVPVTAGAMPATINPGTMTATVGGWPIYIVLSAA